MVTMVTLRYNLLICSSIRCNHLFLSKKLSLIFGLYRNSFYICTIQNERTMKQLSKLWKLTKGTFNMLLVFGYVIYLYGIVGFVKASRGINDKKVDDYMIPLIWNFITLSITTILIFKK